MKISDLDHWLSERYLNGFWNRQGRPYNVKPYLWKWTEIHEGLRRAMELVPMDKTGRRVIQMRNPGLEAGMTHTIHLAVQAVMPGEIARAHRHVAAAIRYVIRGSSKCFTIVEGERFPMQEGDLITTPNWAWHDHHNASDEPVVWVDGLDSRLVTYLDTSLFEDFPRDQQPIEKPDDFSARILGHVRPSWMRMTHSTPAFRYGWQETYATLLSLKGSEGDPYDGIRLEYVNPFNGGSTLPTFSCEIQLLIPNQNTQSHRHTSTAVYFVYKGHGATTVDNELFKWDQGDFFVIPPWRWHAHANDSDQDAILFSIDDRPAMTALGLYRVEGKKSQDREP